MRRIFKLVMCKVTLMFNRFLERLRTLDFIAPLFFRLFLFMVFWEAGLNKFIGFESTVYWFDVYLNMPFPYLMAFLATAVELVGSVLLLIGLGTSFVAIALIITMLVAIFAVHIQHGFLAIAAADSYWFGTFEGAERLKGFLSWLENAYPERHAYITELGTPVLLNNGFEFALIYLLMLISLLFSGGGKYISLDYYIHKKYIVKKTA